MLAMALLRLRADACKSAKRRLVYVCIVGVCSHCARLLIAISTAPSPLPPPPPPPPAIPITPRHTTPHHATLHYATATTCTAPYPRSLPWPFLAPPQTIDCGRHVEPQLKPPGALTRRLPAATQRHVGRFREAFQRQLVRDDGGDGSCGMVVEGRWRVWWWVWWWDVTGGGKRGCDAEG